MSSDSEDDFSYTNSAKLLKNIKNKVKSSIVQNVIKDFKVDDEVILVETPDNTNKRKRKTRLKNNCSEIDNNNDRIVISPDPEISIIDISTENEEAINNENDSVLLDTSLTDNYKNLLEKVSSYIDGNKRKSQRKRITRSNTKFTFEDELASFTDSTKRVTRSARKRGIGCRKVTNNIPISTIVIDPDIPIINSESIIPDDINEEIMIKILWKSQKLVHFKIRQFQPFKSLFEHFSKEENISEERLLFTFNEQVITMKDTPHSLSLNLTSVIEGGVLSNKTHLTSGMSYKQDTINLKVQIQDRKQPLIINMKTTDDMRIFMFKCSEELKLPIQKLMFTFDGEIISPNNTPVSLEFEGGECIDCIIKKV